MTAASSVQNVQTLLARHGLKLKTAGKAKAAIARVLRIIAKAYKPGELRQQARAVIALFKDERLFEGGGFDTLVIIMRKKPAHVLAFFFLGVGKGRHFESLLQVARAMRACDEALGTGTTRDALERDPAEALEALENMHIGLFKGKAQPREEEKNPLAVHLHATLGGHYGQADVFINDTKNFMRKIRLSNEHLKKRTSAKHWRRIAEAKK